MPSAKAVPLVQSLSAIIHQIIDLRDEISGWNPFALENIGLPNAVAGPSDLLEMAHRRYVERRCRSQYFPETLFGEPAWDILLDLFVAAEAGQNIHVTSACIAADVPATTALRWLQELEAHGLIERHADPNDARRSLVKLTSDGYGRMATYLTSGLKMPQRPNQGPAMLSR